MQKINKNQKIIIIAIIICSLGIIIHYVYNQKEKELKTKDDDIEIIEDEEIPKSETNETIEKNKQTVIVYITGAVKKEGVYKLEENSRISDAIEIAGGLQDNANKEEINLAYILEDGMKIYIPKKEEKLESNTDKSNTEDRTQEYVTQNTKTNNSNKDSKEQSNSIKININKATQTELETLPGIGPSTALKIIEYRKENGKFKQIEDIKNVKGIGENKYNQIKSHINV